MRLLEESEKVAIGRVVMSGKQYIVIACGGGKNGAPSGGTYVAFALP